MAILAAQPTIPVQFVTNVTQKGQAPSPSQRYDYAYLLQRGRSWEAVLQRLTGPSGPQAKGSPNGLDEPGHACSAPKGDEQGHVERNTASQDLTRGLRKKHRSQ